MAISLPADARDEAVESLQAYFRDERGEDIGALQASILLDFFLAEIGPSVYNQAVRDAQARLSASLADLDADLHEPEFAHSAARRSSRPRR